MSVRGAYFYWFRKLLSRLLEKKNRRNWAENDRDDRAHFFVDANAVISWCSSKIRQLKQEQLAQAGKEMGCAQRSNQHTQAPNEPA